MSGDERLAAEARRCRVCKGRGWVVVNPDWPAGEEPYRAACPEGDHGLVQGTWEGWSL